MSWRAAKHLMELGFKVFPVIATYNPQRGKWDKKPVTENGFKDAVCDPSQAEEMFIGYDWIGMVHNNMTVVDADGEQGVETLNLVLPLLPEASVVTRTISGSIHYIIAGSLPQRSRKPRMLPGLDILTGNDKGFIVVPPSPGYKIISGSFEELAEGIDGLGGETPVSEGAE